MTSRKSLCQPIFMRRRSCRRSDMLGKVKLQTVLDETETVIAEENSSTRTIDVVSQECSSCIIVGECCPPYPPHHHEQEPKVKISQSIQEILHQLCQERNAYQSECDHVMNEIKQGDISSNDEKLSILQLRKDVIHKSIADLIELQYSVDFLKTEKQLRKIEKSFDKFWQTVSLQRTV
jgi:hypothetical protein